MLLEEVISSVANDFKGISRDLSVVVAYADLLQINTANNLDMMKGLDKCVESSLVNWPSFQEFYTCLTGTAAGAEPAAALELRLSTLEALASRRRPTLA
jgi:hypothetical protein